MAKQVVNPIERHVEKALLGVAGIALIAVIVMYAVRSPNQVEIGGEMVTPGEIDAKLAQQAVDVRDWISSHQPKEVPFEPLADQFAAARDPFKRKNLPTHLRAGVSIGPEVPFVDPKGAKPGQAQLVKVQTLGKPLVTHGRSTYILQTAYRPANWVTVASLMNREEQAKVQGLEYGSQRQDVIFGLPQISRRAMRSDGTWSDDDWKTVEVWPTAKIPSLPRIVFEIDDGREIVPRESRLNVEGFQEGLDLPNVQMEILRPLMPTFFNGTKWTFPPVVPCIDILRMDDDYFNPTVVEPTSELALEDRIGLCETTVADTDEKALTPRQKIDKWFEEGRELLARAKATNSEGDATRAFNNFVEITLNSSATSAQIGRGKKLRDKAEQLMRDIAREQRRGRRGGGVLKKAVQERKLQPTQLIWVHDGAPESIESGNTYQYRIRATLFNRLAGEPGKFDNAEDAKVVFVHGDWSPPSDPVVIPATSEFYVTGVDTRKKTVKVEMYQWFDGVWVTTRETFKVGEKVAATKRAEVPDPEESGAVDRASVPFDTGYTVLRIDWGRMQREKKTRGVGIRLQDGLSKGSAVLLAGKNGAVIERFVSTDKANPEKKAASGRVWRPAKKR
ncbi:MAG: hypothetical protein IIB57_00875 [Planctomycetes bacterium]|nr:hypothetical protein [Planctomycetota bacterium]